MTKQIHHKLFIRLRGLFAISLTLAVMVSCLPPKNADFVSSESPEPEAAPPEPSPGDRKPASGADSTPSGSDSRSEVPLLWEQRNSDTRAWTLHAFNVIEKEGAALLLGSEDVKIFCPAYFTLSTSQKINFWGFLISAMAKYESAFNPTMRYLESTMGTDPITGNKVYSEGLLQLSYQDKLAYPFCDEFDWETDSKLSPKDPRKTIFDPFKNLSCGIKILNWQVHHFGLIAVNRGQYWAVLKPNGKYTKLPAIKSMTNKIPFCR